MGAGLIALTAAPARAHVSERAIVLLLPTDLYRLVGVLAVVLTIALTAFLPDRVARRLIATPTPAPLRAPAPRPTAWPAAWLGFAVFAGLIAMGLFGPHNPLGNLLPLSLFTGFWLVGLLVATLIGDWWRWFNPWIAPAHLLGRLLHPAGSRPLPDWLSFWPATGSYLTFALYYLSDLAPVDPNHLARVALAYWLVHLALSVRFGPDWLIRGEGFTLLFALAGRMRAFYRRRPHLRLPGSGLMALPAPPASLGVFVVTLLAIGSFDGLNETFWWMARIGINPLEFPGRSAVVWQNRLGLVGAVLWLNAVFAGCTWLGLRAAGLRAWRPAYPALALALLPIALAYHFAHYLPSALVSLQYWALALNDPLETGAHLLGLDWRVTTSFFNQHWTVRLIWLTQAGLITLGHMLSVVLAHGAATRLFDGHRKALLSQLPVAAFMVAYTWFGLWLLASPTAL